ncbi:Copper Transporter integral membrane protein that functions in high affinity copper transport [Verticillium nonalfalfae]|uniref:Copper transport protein n=1 Tax=Verticillium nonalfalfae TaxID=1051616 RepID=A0A3M9YHQ8_9PEZI|nr:Copper Transporter integral membrane protein that functions in high affinity copper transport [Verticillium nonalfalfae]RNJ60107.1 Copper Transporter integral membrane protein that functions in high affinity copper transport [Verticillium nonalfalfae]
MDHGAMTMASTITSMLMPTATGMDMPAGTDAAATSGHDEMDMSAMMGGCKISMLWNWQTIDSCFISESWHITSTGMFAGSCIGVVLLVLSLEALRRAGKEYDRYLIRSHAAAAAAVARSGPFAAASNDSASGGKNSGEGAAPLGAGGVAITAPFRPSLLQQAVRALLHLLQFAVAYFVMLLAMYYNGYIIICIFIGAYLGSFIFHWEKIGGSTGPTSAGESSTVCCG